MRALTRRYRTETVALADGFTATDDGPALFGHDFDGPMPGHGPGMPIHYDLHAYPWIENADGAFATSNPAIACP